MGNAYYLMVNGAPAAKPYALLREALRRSERVAIASSRCAGGSGWACSGSSTR